jgi:surface carbohydrate biosynthesis protein
MSKKRIYIILEVKERELLAKTLLAIQLSNLDYSIVIGKKNNLYNYAKYFQTGLFFFKGMGKKNIKPMQMLKSLGHNIVGFDEEGLLANHPSMMKERINENCLQLVEKFFTVGSKQLENTIKVYEKYKSKISVIGNVRFDLLKKEYNKFYYNEVEEIKKKYGKFLFISSTFNRLHYGMPEMPPSPGRDFMQSSYDYQKNFEVKLKEFLYYFPNKYKDIKILVRPHPLGSKKYWEDIVKEVNCKNFLIADEKFSTNSYLLASEFSISSNCTTAIESFFLGKPSINFRASEKDGLIVSPLIREISSIETLNVKELEKIILDWFYENKKFSINLTSNLRESIKYNIKNIDKYSYQLFLEQISDLNFTQKIKKDKFSNKFFVTFFRLIKRLKNFKYKILSKKKKNDTTSYEHLKFPNLTKNEVNDIILKFFNLSGYDRKKYELKEIYPGCICLEKIRR